jgi:hypothetical protein
MTPNSEEAEMRKKGRKETGNSSSELQARLTVSK